MSASARQRERRARRREWAITAPSFLWLTIFFAVPTLIIFAIAFKPADHLGAIRPGWTLDTWRALAQPELPIILWRTVRLSALTTAICLLLAVPTGYGIARAPARWRSLLLLFVIVPFWTSFLIRVFAWQVLLHPEGLIKRLLVAVGLASPETVLLYNEGAVLLVLVQTHLPFAILPIYAAAEKFDFRLLEAARDLGARADYAFFHVFLPGIRRGVWTAILMVFIPALGSYVIPDLLGGTTSEMLGNRIAQRALADRNLPQASALSALLALTVLAPLVAAFARQRRRPTATAEAAI